MDRPFMKFYVRDWMSDSQLRMVSLAARGLWFECLCIMHGAKRYGFLESPNGNPIDDDCLCRLIGTFKGQLDDLRAELVRNGVPGVENDTGIWFSRRMVRDAIKYAKCSVAGSRGGGSPILKGFAREEEEEKILDTRYQIPYKFKGTLYTAEFDAFWKFYPRKMKKPDAQKAWVQTRTFRPPTDELIRTIENQKSTFAWKKEDGQFIPYPASWLRAHGWENDIASMNIGANSGTSRRVGGNPDFSDSSKDPLVQEAIRQEEQRKKGQLL